MGCRVHRQSDRGRSNVNGRGRTIGQAVFVNPRDRAIPFIGHPNGARGRIHGNSCRGGGGAPNVDGVGASRERGQDTACRAIDHRHGAICLVGCENKVGNGVHNQGVGSVSNAKVSLVKGVRGSVDYRNGIATFIRHVDEIRDRIDSYGNRVGSAVTCDQGRSRKGTRVRKIRNAIAVCHVYRLRDRVYGYGIRVASDGDIRGGRGKRRHDVVIGAVAVSNINVAGNLVQCDRIRIGPNGDIRGG